MHEVELYKAGLNHLEIIREIGGKTFRETFEDTNTQENLDLYIAQSFATKKLQPELQNPDSEFYLAKSKNQVIGYLKVNFAPAQTEINDPNSLEIERIYILQEHYGKGVGQLLFDKALEIARQAKCSYIWLGVWENNFRALNFYNKNGFVEFDTHVFVMGESHQTDKLLKLQL
jgi:ribosomal protein S18 acetylase RimI-like enzyme